MKAAIVPEHGRLEVVDISPPAPGPYDCLVRIDACAICAGTDLNLIAGNFTSLEATPFVLGHESTGLIVELRGERTRPNACGVRLGDTDHGVDPIGTDSCPNHSAARSRRTRRHERVCPMVEIEQRPLSALEHHSLSRSDRFVYQ